MTTSQWLWADLEKSVGEHKAIRLSVAIINGSHFWLYFIIIIFLSFSLFIIFSYIYYVYFLLFVPLSLLSLFLSFPPFLLPSSSFLFVK